MSVFIGVINGEPLYVSDKVCYKGSEMLLKKRDPYKIGFIEKNLIFKDKVVPIIPTELKEKVPIKKHNLLDDINYKVQIQTVMLSLYNSFPVASAEYKPKNKVERTLLNRTRRISGRKTAKKVYSKIGRIKRKCHTDVLISDMCITAVISILKRKYKNFNWNSYRDQAHMRRYRVENPICEQCRGRRSQHTHHIVHCSHGGKECFDNYQALCIPCHKLAHPELPDVIKDQWDRSWLKGYKRKKRKR